MKLPKHLVFSGGGLNGIQMLKVLKNIEEKVGGSLYSKLPLESVSGVSVGTFIGLCVLLDYTADEFVSHGIPKAESFINIFDEMKVSNLITTYALSNNDNLTQHIDNIISYKLEEYCDKSMSLLELYNHTKVQFNISVTNVNKSFGETWNHITQPDMPVSFAMKTSGCLPLLFAPIFYKNNYYVDGSVFDQFPIDNEKSYTLSIRISEDDTEKKINSFFDYISFMSGVFFNKPSPGCCKKENHIRIKALMEAWDFKMGYFELCQIYEKANINIDELEYFQEEEESETSSEGSYDSSE